MKRIKPSKNDWPRHAVKTVECRKRDLIIRIADWTRQSIATGEPAFDVEVYIGGVYDWNESTAFCLRKMTKKEAKNKVAEFVENKIRVLL